jgi:hypothetical protein
MQRTPEKNQGIASWKAAEKAGPRESAGSIPQRPAPPLRRGDTATL